MKSDSEWVKVILMIVLLRIIAVGEASKYQSNLLYILDGFLYALAIMSVFAMFIPALRIELAKVLRFILRVRPTGPPS